MTQWPGGTTRASSGLIAAGGLRHCWRSGGTTASNWVSFARWAASRPAQVPWSIHAGRSGSNGGSLARACALLCFCMVKVSLAPPLGRAGAEWTGVQPSRAGPSLLLGTPGRALRLPGGVPLVEVRPEVEHPPALGLGEPRARPEVPHVAQVSDGRLQVPGGLDRVHASSAISASLVVIITVS